MTDYSQVIADTREDILRTQKEGNIPGLAIALVDGQETVWAEGFGQTNRSLMQVPVTSRTRFALMSIGKMYTSIGLLTAAEKGLVGLDDPLIKYYPEFTVNSRRGSGDAKRITLRQLVSHRSGLTHEAPLGGNNDYRPHRFDEHIRSISETWLRFRPGERFCYSNLGMDLAAHVLERVSGRPFERYMADEVLGPLGMRDSTFWQAEQCEDQTVARGHYGSNEVAVRVVPMLGAGGLFSTVEDMARCISFQLGGGMAQGKRILREETIREAGQPQFAVPGQMGGYGLGTIIDPFAGAMRVWHGGNGYGYQTAQYCIPEYGVGAAILTNEGSHRALQLGVSDRALRRMIEAKLGQVPADKVYPLRVGPVVPMEADQLRQFEGMYEFMGAPVKFSVQGGHLHASGFDWLGTGLPSEELDAHGGGVFTSGNIQFTFKLGPKGRPLWAEVAWAMCVDRMPLNDTPLDPAGPNRADWADLVGTYSMMSMSGPFEATVSVKNGYLYVDHLKLAEFRPGLFFDCNGNSAEFRPGGLVLGNVALTKS